MWKHWLCGLHLLTAMTYNLVSEDLVNSSLLGGKFLRNKGIDDENKQKVPTYEQ